jgi:hypothetical protein
MILKITIKNKYHNNKECSSNQFSCIYNKNKTNKIVLTIIMNGDRFYLINLNSF